MIQNFYTHDITLYTMTVANSSGEISETWSTGTAIKGRIRPLSANEMFLQNKRTVVANHRMYCDYQTINETYKVVWGSSTFQVIGVQVPFNANRHMQIDLKTVV